MSVSSAKPRCAEVARDGLRPLTGLGEPSIVIEIACVRPAECRGRGCFWRAFRPGAAPVPRKPDQGGLFA